MGHLDPTRRPHYLVRISFDSEEHQQNLYFLLKETSGIWLLFRQFRSIHTVHNSPLLHSQFALRKLTFYYLSVIQRNVCNPTNGPRNFAFHCKKMQGSHDSIPLHDLDKFCFSNCLKQGKWLVVFESMRQNRCCFRFGFNNRPFPCFEEEPHS